MKKQDFIVLFCFLILGVILVLSRGQEASWDLANYHYYNAWAFLHNRIGYDVMPCGLQSYMNPLLDVPFYVLVKLFNNYPRLIMAIQSSHYSISLFLVYLIAKELFKQNNKLKFLIISFVIFIAALDFHSIAELGSTFNDLPISIFILTALLIIIKNLFLENSRKRTINISVAGLLIGVAAGLKASALFFFVSILLSVICFSRSYTKPLKIISLFSVCFALGYLLTNGWWMYIVYSHFKNPFFPYMNQIFKSPLAWIWSYADERYLPRTTLQYLIYPLCFNRDFYVTELWHRDFRHAFLFFSFFFIVIGNFIIPKFNSSFKEKLSKEIDLTSVNFLTVVLFFSYIIWLNTSGVLRYMLPLCLIEGIFITQFLLYFKIIFSEKLFEKIVLGVVLFLILTTEYVPLNHTRIEYQDKFFDFPDLKIPDNANVFIFRGYPISVFIPFQNPKAKYHMIFSTAFNDYDYYFLNEEKEKLKELSKQKNTYILLSSVKGIADLNYSIVSEYVDLRDYSCKQVVPAKFSLYPVVKFCHRKDE